MSQVATPLALRVARKQVEAEGICSLELVATSAGDLPAFSAGAHLDVLLPNGLVRQYSLCNDPAETQRYLIAVLREPKSRGGSQAVHDLVREGDVLQVSAPKNHFPLHEGATRHLLLAGGIGVTPLLAMAQRLHTLGADFQLHAFSRSVERTAFVAQLRQAPYAARVQQHFSADVQVVASQLDDLIRQSTGGCHLYVCGPQGFMDAALAKARSWGWPEAQVHSEFFAAAPSAQAGDGSFDIKLASSGRIIAVQPDQTALQALLDAGVDVPMSCEQGVCGTCLTRVLAGTPEHRDHYLTPEEQAANDQFLPCCSRSKTAQLEIDL